MCKSKDAREACRLCPNRLGNDTPSPLATNTIATLKNKRSRTRGMSMKDSELDCPWYINSKDAMYCFWNYQRQMDGRQHSIAEIATLLEMSEPNVRKVLKSATEKFKLAMSKEGELERWIEAIRDHSDSAAESLYSFVDDAPAMEFRSEIGYNDGKVEESKAPKELRKQYDQPRHISGKRYDMYGLYRDKDRQKKADRHIGRGKKPKS